MISSWIALFGLLVTVFLAGTYTEAWVRGRRPRDGLLALWLALWALLIGWSSWR